MLFFFKNKQICRNRFCNEKHLQPIYKNDWFVLSNVLLHFDIIWTVEVTHPSSVCTWDATSYAPDFLFRFLIWLQAKYLSCFELSSDILLVWTSPPVSSDYHYCTTSFNKVWIQVLCMFKSYSLHVMPEIWDVENLWEWCQLEIMLNAPRRSNISQNQFNSSAIVVPTDMSLKMLSPKTVSSWLHIY